MVHEPIYVKRRREPPLCVGDLPRLGQAARPEPFRAASRVKEYQISGAPHALRRLPRCTRDDDGSGIAHAQADTTFAIPRVPTGSLVRVWSSGPPMTRLLARVERVAGDSLQFRVDGAVVGVPTGDIHRLDQLVPRSRERGALKGFAIGMVTAVIFDAILVVAPKRHGPEDDIGPAILGALATPTFIIGGTLIGAAHPGERWTTVYRR